jgi:hypothetical protein
LPRFNIARLLRWTDRLSRPAVRAHTLAVVFFGLLTVAATWPLVLHFTDRVPGWYIADNYEYLWKMWWFKHALFDLHQSPLVAPQLFYPEGFQLANAELVPLATVLGLPLTWAWGEIPTYNLIILMSFVLSGWAVFALLYKITRSVWAGLLAGTLFVLSPYHVVRYGGILPLSSVEGLPLFLLGVEGWAQSGRHRWAVLAALGFVVAAWGSLYYAFGLALVGPIYVLWRRRRARVAVDSRQAWISLGVAAGICVIALMPLALVYFNLSRQVSLRIPLEDVDFWSASLTDYLIPPALNPIWGEWARAHLLTVPPEYPQIGLEFVLGVGWVCLLFAVYGARHGASPARPALIALTLTALVLSFGPRLHWGRYPITIPAPAKVVDAFERLMNAIGNVLPAHEAYPASGGAGLTVPLPALILRWLLPPLQGMRAWNRFAAFVSLGAACLAGLGIAAWLRREVIRPGDPIGRQRSKLLASGAIALSLAVFELWPGKIPLQPVGPRAVDLWLASQPGQFTIMELPLNSALSAPQMLYSRYHGKRTAFAYGTYFPYWYRQQYPELSKCPEQACLDRLRSWGVRYVLLNLDALPADSTLETDLDNSRELRRITTLDRIIVFQLRL